jgi:GH24 family phage-related lysozyme (muramidase)
MPLADPMELSSQGAAFIRYEEGFVSRWYADATGTGTIGIGFTWASAAFRAWWAKNRPGQKFGAGATMTRAEAEEALVEVVHGEYGAAVNQFLSAPVAQHVYDGMCSVVYNCGAGALGWAWVTRIRNGDIAGGALLLSTTATTSKGKTLAGLVRRRKEEAALIRDGVYAGVTAEPAPMPAAPADAMADGMLTKGERGPAVAALIRDLHALGYYDGVLDDLFGHGTLSAVLAFQRAKKLEADGIAGPKTLAAIAAALAAAGKPPASSTARNTALGVGAVAAAGAGAAVLPNAGGAWIVLAILGAAAAVAAIVYLRRHK